MKTLEDLRGIAEEAMARRKELVKLVELLVRQKTEEIISLLRREDAEPMVSDIYRRADRIRTEEVGKALSHMRFDPDQQKILEEMSISLVEKILGPPAVNLRKAAEKGDSRLLTVAGHIFSGE